MWHSGPPLWSPNRGRLGYKRVGLQNRKGKTMLFVSRFVFAAALGVLPHLLVRTCLAQDPPKSPTPPPKRADEGDSTLKVITLKHADAHSVVSTLKQLDVPLSASATGPQTVVLRGSPADVQRVIDTLIAAVDVPGVTGGSARSAEIIPVRHYPIELIGGLARNVAPKASLGIDEARRTIVVNGTEDERHAVRDLLKQIDWPTRSAKVHFYFLRGMMGGQSPEKETLLPPDLLPIGKSLTQNGFGRLSLIAPIVIGVEEGQRFESKGQLHVGDDDTGRDDLVFYVGGSARLASGGDDAWLTLRGRVGGKFSRKQEGGDTIFELDTTIATKLGNYVILAAAPSSTAAGDAVALVVRLTAE